MKNNQTIFVIQENIGFNSPIVKSLRKLTESQILMYANVEEVQEALQHSTPILLVIDIDFQDEQTRQQVINLIGFAVPSIVLSSVNRKDFAVNLLKKGAIDFVLKEGNYINHLETAFKDAEAVITLQLNLKALKRKQIKNLWNVFLIASCTGGAICILIMLSRFL